MTIHCVSNFNRDFYRKSGNFGYIKFLLEKIFMLKNFRRVDVLRKYFNTKIFTTYRRGKLE